MIPVTFLVAGFLLFINVFAYDSSVAHRALTYEAGEFYNLNSSNELSSQEIEWLMQGTQEEDTPPRWINHFYNPQTGEGWNADRLGGVSPAVLRAFSNFALSQRKPVSAKNWAKNRSAQADYELYAGDQTWQRAIDAYVAGDKKTAYKALGHILHLIQDMTVPDHTRGDTHAGLMGDKGSPYEDWAKEYNSGNIGKLTIAEGLAKSGVKPKEFPILENYFDWNAKYSSENFFSIDTIFAFGKINPVISLKKSDDFYTYIYTNIERDQYLIAKYPKDNNNLKYFTINDPQILSAYWQRLSKQAVISGAGVINLFFKEAEEAEKLRQNNSQNNRQQKPARSLVLSPFGEAARANKLLSGAIGGAKKLAVNLMPQLARTETIAEIGENTNKESPRSSVPVPSAEPRQASRDDNNNDTIEDEEPLRSPMASGSPTTEKKNEPRNDNSFSVITKNESGDMPSANAGERHYVSRVIDGDTITLSNGRDLRLIGMDAPEHGDACYDEARQELERLVLGKYVITEKDKSETDKYNRLLRYLYVDNTQVNAELIKSGFAKSLFIYPDIKYAAAFKMLEEEAKVGQRGCFYASKKDKVSAAPAPIRSLSSSVGWASAATYIDSHSLNNQTQASNGASNQSGQPTTNPTAASSNNSATNETAVATGTPSSVAPTPQNASTSEQSSATTTPESTGFATSTPAVQSPDIIATSTPETSATSATVIVLPDTIATSTPETSATSTPNIAATSTPEQSPL